MKTTCTLLLRRVRDLDDASAWREFDTLYSGLIYHYARDQGLNDSEAAEVISSCMETLVKEMPSFQYDRKRGHFRSWLKTLVKNRITDHIRKQRALQAESVVLRNLKDDAETPDEAWERQWRWRHLLHCWGRIQGQIAPRHAEVFRLCVLEEYKAGEVAEILNLELNNVYQIKARITGRLREELEALLGEEG